MNQNTESKNTKKKTKNNTKFSPQRLIAILLAFIVIVGIIGAGAVAAYALPIIKNAPSLTREDFVSPESTEILTADGQVYYETGRKFRDAITYDDLSSTLIDAFVAAEDSRFFTHNGFDVPRFTKAAINNLVESLKRGRLYFGEGGSTFTMQLIKNTIFVSDGSDGGEIIQAEGGTNGISRKITEIYLSQKLEGNDTLTKKLILELYLNRIDFGVGNNTLGIEKSAQIYFGKSAADLNLVESAFMAGVINAPFANSPYYSIENANEATQRVLYNMHYHGYITDEEYNAAKNIRIENLLVDNNMINSEGLAYQSYVDAVIKEVEQRTGLNPTTTPMRIYTAIDLDVQAAIDEAQARKIASLDYGKENPLNAASTVINNQTGEIVALFGRYDYNGQRMLNLATSNPVNPGSTLKPVVSYAPSYEYLGWSSNHVITDEPISMNGINISNYDMRFLGQITTNTAVGDSRNIPAIKAFNEVREKLGDAQYIEYLRQLGLTTDGDNFGWGYAIGNDPFKVTTTQMAGATAMIFNEGTYITPHTVLKIEMKNGETAPELINEKIQVISPGAAYLTSRNMKYVVDSGINAYTNPLRRSYATFAKTGTVQWDNDAAADYGIPKGSQKDRLMIAANKNFTIATWVGFEKNTSTAYFSTAEAAFNLPGKLNNYILTQLEKKYGTPGDLQVPSDLVSIDHITAVFPYQSPLQDMNPSLVSKSLILKKHATLAQPQPQNLESLGAMNATANSQGSSLSVNVSMSTYPDESKLTVASDVLEMTDANGKKYSGKRLFDESWIYGSVRYKTDIKVNGVIVSETLSETHETTITLAYPNGVSSIQVCSYYTFELAPSVKSNEICKNVEIEEKQEATITVPNFTNRSFVEILQFASNNNMPTPQISFSKDVNRGFGTVVDFSPNISGNKVTASQLASTQLNVIASDERVEAGLKVRDFLNSYSNFITVSNQNINAQRQEEITGFTLNGNRVTSFWLGDYYGSSVTLHMD